MVLQISKADQGEEHALELLYACHDRVRHFSALAARLAAHVAALAFAADIDADARLAATNILRYFEQALPHHHADEEEDVFPALRALDDAQLQQHLDALEAEHALLDASWRDVQPWLKQLEQGFRPVRMPAALTYLTTTYPAHAAREEREVFPAIARLSPITINTIAARMRARRGA